MRHVLLVFILFTSACASNQLKLKVSPEKLAALDETSRAELVPAEKAVNVAMQDVDTLKDKARHAAREVEIAEHVVDRSEADLAIAKLEFDAAQETKAADDILPARDTRTQAERTLKIAKAAVAYREAQQESVEAGIDEARAVVLAGEATLELARFDAVTKTTKNQAPGERAKYEAQIARAAAAVAAAKTDTAAAKVKLEQTKAAWEKAEGNSNTPVIPPVAEPSPDTDNAEDPSDVPES